MDSATWDSLRKSGKVKAILKSAGLSSALSQLRWGALTKGNRDRIETVSKGKGWHEAPKSIITKKGVEKKAPEHHKVAVKKMLEKTLRKPMNTVVVQPSKSEYQIVTEWLNGANIDTPKGIETYKSDWKYTYEKIYDRLPKQEQEDIFSRLTGMTQYILDKQDEKKKQATAKKMQKKSPIKQTSKVEPKPEVISEQKQQLSTENKEVEQLKYAEYVIRNNPIKDVNNNLNILSGRMESATGQHNIPSHIWRKAWNIVARDGDIMVLDKDDSIIQRPFVFDGVVVNKKWSIGSQKESNGWSKVDEILAKEKAREESEEQRKERLHKAWEVAQKVPLKPHGDAPEIEIINEHSNASIKVGKKDVYIDYKGFIVMNLSEKQANDFREQLIQKIKFKSPNLLQISKSDDGKYKIFTPENTSQPRTLEILKLFKKQFGKQQLIKKQEKRQDVAPRPINIQISQRHRKEADFEAPTTISIDTLDTYLQEHKAQGI